MARSQTDAHNHIFAACQHLNDVIRSGWFGLAGGDGSLKWVYIKCGVHDEIWRKFGDVRLGN